MPDPNSAAVQRYKNQLSGLDDVDNINLRPAPDGSLLMLGHITLAVPDACEARFFYTECLDFRRSRRERSDSEVRVNGGLSQFRLPFMQSGEPVKKAQQWPGKIRIWVKDHRETLTLCRKFTDSVNDVYWPSVGLMGIRTMDIFKINEFEIEEAPHHLVDSFMSLSADAPQLLENKVCSICLGDFEADEEPRFLPCNHSFHVDCIKRWLETSRDCPLCKYLVDRNDCQESNVLGIVEVTYEIPVGSPVDALTRFYNGYLHAAAETTLVKHSRYQRCIVHFAPGAGLHQTLVFEENRRASHCPDPGGICVYSSSAENFVKSLHMCWEAGLAVTPGSIEQAVKDCEFHISGIIDPESKAQILPLRHVIRSPAHLECPVRLASLEESIVSPRISE